MYLEHVVYNVALENETEAEEVDRLTESRRIMHCSGFVGIHMPGRFNATPDDLSRRRLLNRLLISKLSGQESHLVRIKGNHINVLRFTSTGEAPRLRDDIARIIHRCIAATILKRDTVWIHVQRNPISRLRWFQCGGLHSDEDLRFPEKVQNKCILITWRSKNTINRSIFTALNRKVGRKCIDSDGSFENGEQCVGFSFITTNSD